MLNLDDIYIEDCIYTINDVIIIQKANGYESEIKHLAQESGLG